MSFGTYRLSYLDTIKMVRLALKGGVSSIDTAQLYMNELAVQIAIDEYQLEHKKDINQAPIYVTSKIHRNVIRKAINDSSAIIDSFNKTYCILPSVKCILLHSPEEGYLEAWRQLIDVADKENIHIGVSNFGIEHLTAIQNAGLKLPLINQIEVTPFNQCKQLVEYCNKMGITITSHSCLTKGERLNDASINQLAAKKKCSAAQILISWCITKGYTPIYRTSSELHLFENITANEIKLTDDELTSLDKLDIGFQTHPQFPFIKTQN